MTNNWYESDIFKGDQTGRTINFPTVNLDATILSPDFKQGIYAASVIYNNQVFKGALYFGPRLVMDETKNVLEIFIVDFDKEIYGESIKFQIKDFIRGIQNFSSLEEMKIQLKKDVEQVEKSMSSA